MSSASSTSSRASPSRPPHPLVPTCVGLGASSPRGPASLTGARARGSTRPLRNLAQGRGRREVLARHQVRRVLLRGEEVPRRRHRRAPRAQSLRVRRPDGRVLPVRPRPRLPRAQPATPPGRDHDAPGARHHAPPREPPQEVQPRGPSSPRSCSSASPPPTSTPPPPATATPPCRSPPSTAELHAGVFLHGDRPRPASLGLFGDGDDAGTEPAHSVDRSGFLTHLEAEQTACKGDAKAALHRAGGHRRRRTHGAGVHRSHGRDTHVGRGPAGDGGEDRGAQGDVREEIMS